MQYEMFELAEAAGISSVRVALVVATAESIAEALASGSLPWAHGAGRGRYGSRAP